MAEYIAKEQIKYHRERVLNHWAGSRHTDCDVRYKDIVTKEDINNIPTTDVIERSKINEAIAEAIKYRDDEKNDFCAVEVGAINGVLEFFKHIGE